MNTLKTAIKSLVHHSSKNLKNTQNTQNAQNTQKHSTEQEISSQFIELLKNQQFQEAELIYRKLIDINPLNSCIRTRAIDRIKEENVVIDNLVLLRKIYGKDFSNKVHQHIPYYRMRERTKRSAEEVCYLLNKDKQNQDLINELLEIWDHSKSKVREEYIILLADESILELFFGINFINCIFFSDILSAIENLLKSGDNSREIGYLCDLLLLKGYKLCQSEYKWKIDIIKKCFNDHPILNNFLILQQKLEINLDDTLDIYDMVYSSERCKDFNLMNYLMKTNLGLFQKSFKWLANGCSYHNHKIFEYFPNWIELCCQVWNYSRKETELEIWKMMLCAGNQETIKLLAPQMKESNQFGTELTFVKDYQTILFLADNENHPLEVLWNNIKTTDSFGLLWLHDNKQVPLNFDSDVQRYHILLCLPHAIEHSNFRYFEALHRPIMEIMNKYLSTLGTACFSKICSDRMIAFLTFIETKGEDLSLLINKLIIKEDLEYLLKHLMGDQVPKIQPKIEDLYSAINHKKPKCSRFLFQLFKDKMPDEIHFRKLDYCHGINELCKEFHLSYCYENPRGLSDYLIRKVEISPNSQSVD